MSVFLDLLDTVPIEGNTSLTFEMQRWLVTLADSMNTTLETIQNLLIGPVITSATTQLMTGNSRYFATNAAPSVFMLPQYAQVNSILSVVGVGAGGWSIVPFTGSGQTIKVMTPAGSVSASASVTSAEQYDTIDLICIAQDTTWVTIGQQTTGFTII